MSAPSDPSKFAKAPRRKSEKGKRVSVSPAERQAYEDRIKAETDRVTYEDHLPRERDRR